MNEIKAFIILMFLVFLVETILLFVYGKYDFAILFTFPTAALGVVVKCIWND